VTQDWHAYVSELGSPPFPVEAHRAIDEVETTPVEGLDELLTAAGADFDAARFLLSDGFLARYVASLLSKRFVILTGLSGSGKTKLAQLFALWLCGRDGPSRYEIVPVGPDWTSTDHVLGYADAIDPTRYVKTQALQLILNARDAGESVPHFLILDEMNLSHVERYFADVLSAIESAEEITLHLDRDAGGAPVERDGVPPALELPPNLFIVGTVNVDETTYGFSPKVLDRANTLEFRVTGEDLAKFTEGVGPIDLEFLAGRGQRFGTAFARVAQMKVDLSPDVRGKLVQELLMLFDLLADEGREFGFRTMNEIERFVGLHGQIDGGGSDLQTVFDAQLLQKILPRLSGSRSRVERALVKLGVFCHHERVWQQDGSQWTLENRDQILGAVAKASKMERSSHPLNARDDADTPVFDPADAHYSATFAKVLRMLRQVEEGFVNFAEA